MSLCTVSLVQIPSNICDDALQSRRTGRVLMLACSSKWGRNCVLHLLNSELFRRGKEKKGKAKKQKKQKKQEVSVADIFRVRGI